MDRTVRLADSCSAWNPGVGTGVPGEFRSLETIFRPERVFGGFDQTEEIAGLTRLPHEELTAFRPQRLALHELIVRVTADIAVSEGEKEEDFGRSFRQIAGKIWDDYIVPSMGKIEHIHAGLREQAGALAREILAQTLFAPPAAPAPRRFPFSLLPGPRVAAAPAEPVDRREHRVIAEYKAAGRSAEDPLRRAVYNSLYRILGAIQATRGSLGSDLELLAGLVVQHVCNRYGSRLIGQAIALLVDAAIERESYARVPDREPPILISLKGASAAGKSSLRPVIKQIMREQGIEPDGYATISPDVWRRLLLDYDALGPAYKYAGHLTSRERMVIDGKLDRYIRDKADRNQAIPHLLVDRFRFDSFSSKQVARVLHNTYARYVETMYMYFVVTPPEETVERGWQRALERGRYKAVEDFLGHSVEAYAGMPKIFFKWLPYTRPEYRYHFLDNSVPKCTFPRTIAFGNRTEMTIRDPAAFVDIERYQKIDINAASPDEVYPPAPVMDVAANCGSLGECIRRIPTVAFVEPASGTAYARSRGGAFELLDAAAFRRMLDEPEIASVFGEIAPHLVERGA
jgi:hypothetical protein